MLAATFSQLKSWYIQPFLVFLGDAVYISGVIVHSSLGEVALCVFVVI